MENIDGKKVKINIKNFNGRTLSNKFKTFLEQNEDKVFTAYFNTAIKSKIMYELVEDTSTPKWLFWIEDLIVVGEDNG